MGLELNECNLLILQKTKVKHSQAGMPNITKLIQWKSKSQN